MRSAVKGLTRAVKKKHAKYILSIKVPRFPSIKVNSSKEEGDFEAAKTYSKWAKYLSCAAIIIGVILLIVVVVAVAVQASNQ